MKVIAEIGSCWLRDGYPLDDAIHAALACGADLVKIQWWSNEWSIMRRRAMVAGLDKWKLSTKEVHDLLKKWADKCGKPVIGFSVFDPKDVQALQDRCFNDEKIPAAFIKTASQEWQWAALAEAVSGFSLQQDVPLYVSVPAGATMSVGNYWSGKPITWLYCVPEYPAEFSVDTEQEMRVMINRLPGFKGVSDHTFHERPFVGGAFDLLRVTEKHFCYTEDLRGKCPDGGPWSLSPKNFEKYMETAHGVG